MRACLKVERFSSGSPRERGQRIPAIFSAWAYSSDRSMPLSSEGSIILKDFGWLAQVCGEPLVLHFLETRALLMAYPRNPDFQVTDGELFQILPVRGVAVVGMGLALEGAEEMRGFFARRAADHDGSGLVQRKERGMAWSRGPKETTASPS